MKLRQLPPPLALILLAACTGSDQRTAEAGSALDDSRPSFLTIQVASSPEEITYHSYKITLVVDDEDLSTPPKTVDAALPEYTGSDDYAMLLAAALENLGVAATTGSPNDDTIQGRGSHMHPTQSPRTLRGD